MSNKNSNVPGYKTSERTIEEAKEFLDANPTETQVCFKDNRILKRKKHANIPVHGEDYAYYGYAVCHKEQIIVSKRQIIF